jgi:hypothetical protein
VTLATLQHLRTFEFDSHPLNLEEGQLAFNLAPENFNPNAADYNVYMYVGNGSNQRLDEAGTELILGGDPGKGWIRFRLRNIGGQVAGAVGELQFNSGTGEFGASSDLAWDNTSSPKVLTVGGNISLTSGGQQTTLRLVTPTAPRTITFPDATGTVGLVAGSTGQLAFNDAGAYAGTTGLTYSYTDGLRTSQPFGYGPSSGGSVTQTTSKSTDVTLNTPCGRVTTDSQSLSPGNATTFTLINSLIGPGDVLVINHISGGTIGKYTFSPACGTGSATITIRNVSGNNEGEALVFKYVLIKACVGGA